MTISDCRLSRNVENGSVHGSTCRLEIDANNSTLIKDNKNSWQVSITFNTESRLKGSSSHGPVEENKEVQKVESDVARKQ